ncbi:MAG: G8 domain-containing protein [Thiobacillus sp.]
MKRPFKIFALLVPLIGLSAWGGNAYAAACVSQATGNWNTAATWNCGHVPAVGDTATITLGQTVTLNTNSNVLASLTVNGTLTTLAGSSADLYIGGNIVNNGTINMQLSTSTNTIYLAGANVTSTFSGTGTWLLDNLDMNGTNTIPCTGACKVELSGSPNLQFINATLFSAASATFTFNALGNSTATVTLNRAGNQTVAATGVTYPNLVLGGSGNKTPGAGTINVLGSLTVNSGVTWAGNTNNPATNVGGSLIINGTYTAGSGTTSVAGNFSNSGTFTANTSTVTFNGTAAQSIGGSVATPFNNLTVANTGAGNTTLLINTSVAGNLSVNSGTLYLSTFTANRTAAGGTITVANGATLDIGGTNAFPASYTTHAIGATSTVAYSGASQSVAAEGAPGYGNLTLSGSGTKTAAGSFITRGSLTISGVTLASGAFTQTVNGNVNNTGTQTATTGSITLSGGAASHTLSGNGVYANLILNDASGATLAGSPTVSGVLTLTSGILSTGANTLEVTSNCTTGISAGGATTYVQGNLTLHYPTNAGTTTCTFPIGSAAAYSPATVAMLSVSSTLANSSLTARTDAGDHADTTANLSGVDPAKSVNRYWTLTPGGSLSFASYNTTFTFVAGDIDGGAIPATFVISRKNSGAWSYPAMGAANALNTTATGMTQAGGFGGFVIGKRSFPALTILKSVAVYSDPVNGTINPKYIPGADVLYTLIVTNFGAGTVDSDTLVIADPIPTNTQLFVGDLGGGSGPIAFANGTPSSGLTYTFTSLGSATDDVEFYDASNVLITPVSVGGYDANVARIVIKPKGTMAANTGSGGPSFSLQFRVQVK